MQDATAVLEKENISTAVELKRAEYWNWAIALVKTAGLSPSPDLVALTEREARGEITTKDIKNYLDMKYKVKRRD